MTRRSLFKKLASVAGLLAVPFSVSEGMGTNIQKASYEVAKGKVQEVLDKISRQGTIVGRERMVPVNSHFLMELAPGVKFTDVFDSNGYLKQRIHQS